MTMSGKVKINVQGNLAWKKTHPPRTLPWAYAYGPRGVLRGWAFSYGRGSPVSAFLGIGVEAFVYLVWGSTVEILSLVKDAEHTTWACRRARYLLLLLHYSRD